MDPTSLVHPEQALAVFAESLAAGGQVAVFGDASLGLARRLVEVGARKVFVWDPDAERARAEDESAPAGVRVSRYESRERAAQDVDLAIVPDLGLFPNARELIARAHHIVGDHGVVLLAAANRDVTAHGHAGRAFEYYELFDLVAGDFKVVTMIAELPFHGVSLVTLGVEGEAPEVSVDTQLAGETRVPPRFVVVASQREVEVEPYTVVELPYASVIPAAQAEVHSPLRVLPERTSEVESALRAQTARTSDVESALRAETERAAVLQATLGVQAERAAVLEATLADRDRQAAEFSSRIERSRSESEAARTAAAESDAALKRDDSVAARVRALESERAQLSEANAAEIRQFEEVLRERARTVRSLELDLAAREQMVRELVESLQERLNEAVTVAEASPTSAPNGADLFEENGRLRELLDSLALEAARRESDARAMAWSVSELERRLEVASTLAAPPGPPSASNSR